MAFAQLHAFSEELKMSHPCKRDCRREMLLTGLSQAPCSGFPSAATN